MINKSYKIWIILFIIVNLLLLVWSLGYFKFIEEKFEFLNIAAEVVSLLVFQLDKSIDEDEVVKENISCISVTLLTFSFLY